MSFPFSSSSSGAPPALSLTPDFSPSPSPISTLPTDPSLASGLQSILNSLPAAPAIDPGKVLSGATSLGAPSASTLPSILPFLPVGGQPFSAGNPAALKAYAKKYTTLLPMLQSAGIAPQYINALSQYDAARVSGGTAPLNNDQTLKALQSAITKSAATPAPQTPWWNVPVNAFHDLSNIVSSVPQIPGVLLRDVTHAGEIPGDISKALATPGGLGGKAEALSTVPGINLVPGVHTLADVLAGHFSDIATHPISTTLDVLPAAHSLGLGERLAGSVAGDVARQATDAAGSTRLGQLAKTLWGNESRQLAITASGVVDSVKQSLNPAVASPEILDNLAKDSVRWAQTWHDQLPDERVRYLTDAAERGTWASDPTITDSEQAALSQYRTITDRYARYGVDHDLLTMQAWLGGQEVFTPEQAARLVQGQKVVQRYQAFTPVANAIRAAFRPLTDESRYAALTDTPESVQSLISGAHDYINSPATAASKRSLLQGIAHVHDTYGFTLPDNYRSLVNSGQFSQALDSVDGSVMPSLNPSAPDQLKVAPWLEQSKKYTDAGLARVRSSFDYRQIATSPARWSPIVEDAVKARVGEALRSRGFLVTDNPNYDLYNHYYQDGLYSHAIADGLITTKELSGWMNEARQTVLDAKAGGLDPLFMHRVGNAQANEVNFPKPLRTIQDHYVANPKQVRARTMYSAPYVHDLSVGLTHQGLEWLNMRNAKSFLQEFLRTAPKDSEVTAPFARTEASLRAQYDGSGRAMKMISPTVDHDSAVKAAIDREWVKYPVETLSQDVKDAIGVQHSSEPGTPYISRPVYNNLRMFIRPPDLPHAFDLPTNVFRNSVLAFSPRWHLNSMVSGMILTAAQTDLGVFKYLKDASEAAKAAEVGDYSKLPEGTPSSFTQTYGSTRDPLVEWNQARVGGKMAEWWNQLQEKSQAVNAASTASSALIRKSFSLGGFFHDTYRTMAYLYGTDKALTAGHTAEEAAQIGEQLARKTIMTWDSMTPAERVILKSVFPFYGFTQHILRYAYHYPIDHPFRASVVSSVARTELADLGTGLPQSLLGSMFLGHPDLNGNYKTVNVGSLNPFRDVANYMTLAGFLKGANPLLSTALEQVGVDLSQGGTNLYPNVSFDPDTGRLTASHPNPLTNLLYNTIPQSELLTGLLDKGSEIQTLALQNPGAGFRLALAQAGLPVLYKTTNIPETAYKAEVARESAQSTTLSSAINSGNWRAALAYPQLRPILGQFSQLQQTEDLSHYNTSQQLDQMQQLIAATVGSGGGQG